MFLETLTSKHIYAHEILLLFGYLLAESFRCSDRARQSLWRLHLQAMQRLEGQRLVIDLGFYPLVTASKAHYYALASYCLHLIEPIQQLLLEAVSSGQYQMHEIQATQCFDHPGASFWPNWAMDPLQFIWVADAQGLVALWIVFQSWRFHDRL